MVFGIAVLQNLFFVFFSKYGLYPGEIYMDSMYLDLFVNMGTVFMHFQGLGIICPAILRIRFFQKKHVFQIARMNGILF